MSNSFTEKNENGITHINSDVDIDNKFADEKNKMQNIKLHEKSVDLDTTDGSLNKEPTSGDSNLVYETTLYEEDDEDFVDFRKPTPEEEKTLRRTTGNIKWYLYFLLLVEFAERASYYGVSDRINNFVELPLPDGSKSGKVYTAGEDPGALNMSLSRANSTLNALSFFAYCFPLVTSYFCDMYFKRMTMLKAGVFIGILAHILFIIAAVPSVIAQPNASYGVLFAGIFVLSWCCACIKPCLLPTILEQYPHQENVVTKTKKGEKVILDREQTLNKITNWFYFSINLGSITDIGIGYSARNCGYWVAFLIPLCIFMILPFILWPLESKIYDPKPAGTSVMNDIFKLLKVAFEGNFIKRIKNKTFWEYPKPSYMQEAQPDRVGWRKNKPGWYPERVVNDTKVTLSACVFFLYYVMFNINDMGLGALLNNLSASMTTNGVPNDVINNFNPLAIIFFVPFLDLCFYPLCRKMGIHWKPTWKIFTGFMIAALAMMVGAILQSWVYKHSPCGDYASSCDQHAPITLWYTAILYALTGLSECFAMTSAYAIAFLRAPNSMKTFVMALFLFTTALSSIMGIIISPAMVDPLLVRVFIGITVVGAAFAFGFLFQYWNLDETMAEEMAQQKMLDLAQKQQEEADLLIEQNDAINSTSYELNEETDGLNALASRNTHRGNIKDLENLSPIVSAEVAAKM